MLAHETIQALCLMFATWSECSIMAKNIISCGWVNIKRHLAHFQVQSRNKLGQLIGGGFWHLCWQRFRQQNSSWLLCSCRFFPSHPWTCSPSPLDPGYRQAWPKDIAVLLSPKILQRVPMRLIIGQELPGEVGVKVLPVNHVQDWVELVCRWRPGLKTVALSCQKF